MARVRLLAGAVSLLNGVWGLVAGLDPSQIFGAQLSQGGGFWVPVVGGLLLLDSLACVVGLRTALYGSVALSPLLLLDLALWSARVDSFGFAASVLLGAAVVVLDVIAIRHRDMVSEESHPLNLPVFG